MKRIAGYLYAVLLLAGESVLQPSIATGQIQYLRNGYLIQNIADRSIFSGTGLQRSFRDHAGRLWLAGAEGLFRYDKTEFKLYAASDGVDHVDGMAEDSQGNLYVLQDSIVLRYDLAGVKPFRQVYSCRKHVRPVEFAAGSANDFYFLGGDGRVYRNGRLLAIADSALHIAAGTNCLFVQAAHHKIYVVTGSNVAGRYTVAGSGVMRGPFSPFVQDSRHDTWLIGHRLYHLTASGVADSLPMPGEPGLNNLQVAFMPSGKEYYAMSKFQLYHYDGAGLKYIPRLYTSLLDSFSESTCLGLFADPDGTLWCMNSLLGLRYLRKAISGIRGADFWIATIDNQNRTIYKYDSMMRQHPNMLLAFPQLFGKITSVFEDRSGNILFALEDGIVIQRRGERKVSYLYQSPEKPAAESIVNGILQDRSGAYWGLKAFQTIRVTKDGVQTFPVYGSQGTYCLSADDELWMVSGGRIAICSAKGLKNARIAGRPLNGKPVTLRRDPDDNMWVMYSNKVMYKAVEGPGDELLYTDSISLRRLDSRFDVRTMFFDRRRNLWLAFRDILYVVRPDAAGRIGSGAFAAVTERDGALTILENSMLSLEATDDGRILSRGDIAQHVINSPEVYQKFAVPVPRPYITGLLLFNRRHDWLADGYAMDEYGLPVRPRLRYDQNTLTFHYSSLGTINAPYYKYAYRLLGQETEWQPGDADRSANYTNLSPGHYRFELRVANENGVAAPVLSYRLTILPPWYLTWWGRALWISLILGSLAAAFYLRQRTTIRKYQVEQQITEQRLIALRAQINPHFLQNTFAFLGQQVMHNTKEATLGVLKRVSAYLAGILHASDRTVTTLEEELIFIEEYLALQQVLFSNKITYELSVADDVDTPDLSIPSMLLQPLVENSVKYGTIANGHCFIAVSVVQDERYITCRIADNGTGSPQAARDGARPGRGLALTRSKLELMFGKYTHPPRVTLEHHPGKGYTATVYIPVA